MPLFKSHREPSPEPVQETPTRKGSIFSRRYRDNSPNAPTSATATAGEPMHDGTADNNRRGGGGFFSRHRSPSSSDDSSMATGRSSTMNSGHRLHNSKFSNDPSIIAAKQKVSDAEGAEKDADRALVQARAAVREAKDHVKRLEREIEEE